MKITTAKEMRKLAKERRKQAKLEEKRCKANESISPAIMQTIITEMKNSDSCLHKRYIVIDWESHEEIARELYNNFNAYKRAFRKLGYKLIYASDSSGSEFYVNF